MFERIPGRTLSATVAQQLQKEIEKGTFALGEKLPSEAVLAQDFGVSRTVVREALSRLKSEGIVEGRQGSGIYVLSNRDARPLRIDYREALEPESVLQLLALRRAIEAEAAAEAAIRRTDEQMAAIDAALAKIDASEELGKGMVEEDVAFHNAIAVASGNPYLAKTLAFLKQYLAAGMVVARKNQIPGEDFTRQLRDEHAAIAAAIRARDPMAASAATNAHLYNVAQRLARNM